MLSLLFFGTAGAGFLRKKTLPLTTAVGIGSFSLVLLPGYVKEPSVVEEIRKEQTVLPDTTSQKAEAWSIDFNQPQPVDTVQVVTNTTLSNQELRNFAINYAKLLNRPEPTTAQEIDSITNIVNEFSRGLGEVVSEEIKIALKYDTLFAAANLDYSSIEQTYDSLFDKFRNEIQPKLDSLNYDSLRTTNSFRADKVADSLRSEIYPKYADTLSSLKALIEDKRNKYGSLWTSYNKELLDNSRRWNGLDSLFTAHNLAVVGSGHYVFDVDSIKQVTVANRPVKLVFGPPADPSLIDPTEHGFYGSNTIILTPLDRFIFSSNPNIADRERRELSGVTDESIDKMRYLDNLRHEATHALLDINGTLTEWENTGAPLWLISPEDLREIYASGLPPLDLDLFLEQLNLRANDEFAAYVFAISVSLKPKLNLVLLANISVDNSISPAYRETARAIFKMLFVEEFRRQGTDSVSISDLARLISESNDANTRHKADSLYRTYIGEPLDSTSLNQVLGIKVEPLPNSSDSTFDTTKTTQPKKESSLPGSEPKPGFCETIHPDSTYLYLGVSYLRSGDIKEAIRNLNRAKELNPLILPEELKID
jgi:hypothetical protein